MITKEAAQELVLAEINRPPLAGSERVIGKVIAKEYGWIFCYQSKRYLETGDIHHRLAGNVPIVVEHDGSLHLLPITGGRTLDEMIGEYERRRGAQGGGR
jgi:Immunity protein 35